MQDRYPQMWINGRSIGIHRIALELHLGAKLGLRKRFPLAPGVMVLHRPNCVSKACVEGSHLRTGDASTNLIDAIVAGHRPIKLDPPAARQIQRAPRTRPARRRLAEEFGVTAAHVRAVQAGRCWSWIDERAI